MPPFSRLALLASVVACVITDSLGTHYPTPYYVDNNCITTITVYGDARIQLSYSSYLSPNLKCAMSFRTSSGTALTAKFISYSMYYLYTSEVANCPYESIQLFDANLNAKLNMNPYCSRYRPNANYILGNGGKFSLNTGLYSLIRTATVELLVTEIRYRSDFVNGTCPVSYFDCGNSYCISKDLTCNGYDDCGNNADEKDGCTVTLAAGVVAGIVVVVIVFIVVVVVASFSFRRYRQRIVYTQRF